MNRKILMKSMLIGLMVLLLPLGSFAKGPEQTQQHNNLAKTTALDPVRTLCNINNWSYWLYYDGKSGIDPAGSSGGVYPRGTAGVIYEDGVVWGAKVNGNIQVGGSTYRTGTSPVLDRIYRIRGDWATLAISAVKEDAGEFFQKKSENVTDAEAQSIIDQYKKDWMDWPVAAGAPYVDDTTHGQLGVYDPVLDDNGMPDPTKGDYPGIASADQVVFYVANDADAATMLNFAGSDPMGVELQVTMWSYNQKSARLGQLMFKKYKLINTSTTTFDSMYVAQWCDPDLGNYSDDVVGCDPNLGFAFAYNGAAHDDAFDDFGLAPSAVGYDFFQGPIVDGQADQDLNGNGVLDDQDYAVFNLKQVGPGKINLPMTAFLYFSAGNTEWSDPPLGNHDGTLEWYNLLRGFISTTDVQNPTPFTHRATGEATKFPLDGDPAAGTGDLDGQGANFAPADRRMGLATGPFTMAPGDEQEVVVAVLGGSGSDYLNSVVQVKETDKLAQQLYNDLFTTIPKAPPSPQVVAAPFENQIVLNWGNDLAALDRTEKTKFADSDSTEYDFQGYNIYQISYGIETKIVRIGTFDKVDGVTTIEQPKFLEQYGVTKTVPVQFGKDNGVQRYFVIDKNYITGGDLFPGNTYYFAVTAYNYNPDPQLLQDKTLESSMIVIPVTTQGDAPGKKVTGTAGDTPDVTHSSGGSDGVVKTIIVDPSSTTGHEYSVFFAVDEDTNSATFGEMLWGLKDNTTSTVILNKQPQAASIDGANDAPIADGLQIRVSGPSFGVKAIVEVANAGGPLTEADYDGAGTPYGGNNVWLSLSAASDGNRFYVSAGGGDGTSATAYARYARSIANLGSNDAEIRFTADTLDGKYLWWYDADVYQDVRFKAYDVGISTYSDTTDDIRLLTGGYSGGATVGVFDFTDTDQVFGFPASDWIYLRKPANADGTYDKFDADLTSGAFTYSWWAPNSYEVLARLIFCDFGGGGTLPEAGTVVRFITNKPNATTDTFTFTAPAVEQSVALEKSAAEKVTVFPNPYYAGNAQESNRFNRFVTFYHLTEKATVRIFNLGGEQVRKLEKPASNTTQFMQWDLRNGNSLPVASGIYFAHVEMTLSNGSKVTKVLKLFVIQRRQQIKFF